MEIINDLNLVDSINLIKNSVSGNILTDMNIATENITNNSVHQTTELLNTLISKNINNFNNKIINDKTENILKIGSSISLEPFLGMNFLPASSKTIPTLQDGLKKMWASYKDLFILNNQEISDLYNMVNNYKINIPSSGLLILSELIANMLNEIINLIDLNCYNYTGFNIQEIFYYCSTGFLYLKNILNTNHLKNKNLENNNKLNNYSETSGKDIITNDISNKISNKNSNKNTIYYNYYNINSKETKQNLVDWLEKQNDSLWNGFILCSLYNEIKNINKDLQKDKNLDLNTAKDDVSTISLLLDIYKEAGVENGNKISIDNIKNSTINGFSLDLKTLKNITSNKNKNKNNYLKYFNLITNDNEMNKLSLIMYDDPTTYTSELYSLLSNSNLFNNSTINSIIKYSKSFYNNNSENNVITFKSKNNLYYQILFLKQNSSIDSSLKDTSINVENLEILSEVYVEENKKRNVADVIFKILNLLNSIIDPFNQYIQLFENYETNKRTSFENARLNLAYLDLDFFKSFGLNNIINLSNENVYTIRTNNLYNKIKTINSSIKIINGDNKNIIKLSEDETNQLNSILIKNNYNSSLNLNLQTNLFIDIDTDDENLNGSFNNLKNIEYIQDISTIVYSNKDLPKLDSQILLAMNNSKNNNTDISIDKETGLQIVNTDEIEGKQIIDLNKVKVCSEDNYYSANEFDLPYQDGIQDLNDINSIFNNNIISCLNSTVDNSLNVSYINNLYETLNSSLPTLNDLINNKEKNIVNNFNVDLQIKNTKNHAIIEFGDEYIQASAEEYKLNIIPNQTINSETILGSCLQDNKMKSIKSIFKYGTIRSKNNNEFYRLYEDFPCNRHFIIDNYELDGDDNNLNEQINLQRKFQISNSLFNLILDNLNYSLIPNFILKSKISDIVDSSLTPTEILKEYELYLNDMKNITYNFKYTNKKKTKYKQWGFKSKISDLFSNIEKLRNDFLDDLDSVNEFGNKILDLEISAVYSDFNINSKDENKIGLISCYEYYKKIANENSFAKISNSAIVLYYKEAIDNLQTIDASDNVNQYVEEYKSKLTSIYNNRFLYNEKFICNSYSSFIKNYNFANLYNIINENFKNKVPTIQELKDFFNSNNLIVPVITKNIDNTGKLYINNDTEKYLENFISNYLEYKNFVVNNNINEKIIYNINLDTTTSETLAKEEYNILNTFWENIIILIKGKYNFKNVIEEFKLFASSENAIWPSPMNINIDNTNYDLYEFKRDLNKILDVSLGNENKDLVNKNLENYNNIPNISTYQDMTAEEATEKFNQHKSSEINSKDSNISIVDLKYWKKYFALATIATLIPIYWNTGLIIHFKKIKFPAIYIPIFVKFIKSYDTLMVYGLCVRGISIHIISMYVNTSNNYISILDPLMANLRKIRYLFNQNIFNLEMNIPNLCELYREKLEIENQNLEKENKQLTTLIQNLKNIQIPKYEDIKRDIDKRNGIVNTKQKIIRLENLINKSNG